MFEHFKAYLINVGGLTVDEVYQIKPFVSERQIAKKEFLLKQGDYSNFNAFVAEGCLKLYQIGANGDEHILQFAIENWWISDYESYHNETPSKNYIDALENSVVYCIQKQDFEYLLNTVQGFKIFIDKLNTRNYSAVQQRVISNISYSAKERYEFFANQYPTIFNRVPLRLIASYLGVTRETLTRLRAQHLSSK